MNSRMGLAAAFGAAAFLAVDFLFASVRMPLWWYLPLERRFEFQTLGTGVAMDFYGTLLACAGAGLLAAGAAWAGLARGDAETTQRWEPRLIAWLAVTLMLAGALHVTQLVQRNPVPLALPP